MNDDLKRFILVWNHKYPVDRWWREKHKIAFNSPAHRISNFWDQVIEFREDLLYDSLSKGKDYVMNDNDWLDIEEKDQVSIEEGITDALEEIQRYKQHLDKQ